jgi:hypothetical protein
VTDCRSTGKVSADFRYKCAVTAAACQVAGWEFRLVGEPDPVWAANLRWLAGYRHPRYGIPALAGALRASLPGWTWPEPDGGLCLWARLPGEADSGAFAQAALRHGVAVVPGRLLSASTEASSFVRLAFIQPPDVLRSAVRRLAAIPAPSR